MFCCFLCKEQSLYRFRQNAGWHGSTKSTSLFYLDYFVISCIQLNVDFLKSVVFVCLFVCLYLCVGALIMLCHWELVLTKIMSKIMNMNYFEPSFYLAVRLIMHSGDESAGICCSSQWRLWACWGRNVDSVKFVLPCRRRDRIHPFFSVRIFWLYTLKSNIVPTNSRKNIRIMQLQTRHFYLVLSFSGEVVQLTQIMFITSTGWWAYVFC